MKKAEKKEAKKKSSKKKDPQPKGTLTDLSEGLTREFNKKMKEVIKEVKKDTKKAIKNLMKEARQKIEDSAALIQQDLLKNTAPETPEDSTAEAVPPTPQNTDDAHQPETSGIAEREDNQATQSPTPAKVAPPRTRKTKAVAETEAPSVKPTRARKPVASKNINPDNPENDRVTNVDS